MKLKLEEKQKSFETELGEMVMLTSKKSALQALNLNQLLTPKWTEEKNSYKLLSNIRT